MEDLRALADVQEIEYAFIEPVEGGVHMSATPHNLAHLLLLVEALDLEQNFINADTAPELILEPMELRYITGRQFLTLAEKFGVRAGVVDDVHNEAVVYLTGPEDTITALKRIAAGEYGITIEKKFNDEIGELADSINFMSSETQRSIMIKNDFISSVSHELRTPLTAINGWAETLLHSEGLDKIEQRGLSVILRESNHLREMVEELLDFSRIESGRLVINKTTMDVKAELEDTILMFEQRLQQDKLHVVYTDCCGSEVLIQGDRSRLRQVFVNIIDNARKYSPPNETIDIKIERRSEWAAVVIADHGPGIPAADLPRVKQKFYKGNANKPGSGIGLAVSDEIIQMHGGELRIESEEGDGTVVTILLPLDRR